MILTKQQTLFFFIVAYIKHISSASRIACQTEVGKPIIDLQDGRLGKNNIFPWLGLLIVTIHDEGTPITALTGIVFVTRKHALASADDIAKMPTWIFKKRTKAMFIPVDGKPQYYSLIVYVTHPEYKKPTINTLALVSLMAKMDIKFPEPICWDRLAYNNKDHLYVVGFTDEYDDIEKFVHKARLVDDNTCNDFYVKDGLYDRMRLPTHYKCVYTVNKKSTCVWDTGMALVSNSTGHWVLVGFDVYGPGCRAPAPFIYLLPYYKWIRTLVNFQSPRPEGKMSSRASRRFEGLGSKSNTEDLLSSQTEELFKNFYRIERISHQTVIIAINTNNPHADCNDLIFSEHINLLAPSGKCRKLKTVSYKLTLYDLYRENITCVHVSLIADNNTNAYTYVEDSTFHQDDTLGWEETPLLIQKQILKTIKNNSTSTAYKPLFQYPYYGEFAENNLLYFRFQFESEARFVVKLMRKMPTADADNQHNIKLIST